MPPGLRRYCRIVILFHICSRPGLRRYCRIVIKNILFHICSRPGLRRYCLIVIKNILFHICSRPGLRRYFLIVIKNILFHICSRPGLRTRWLKYKNWLGIFGVNSGNICPAWASQFNTFYSQFQKYKFSKFTAYDRQAFQTHD